MEQTEKLFSEFPPVTTADWEAKIREDLKGADYAKKLIRKTLDNITIKPYYTSEDLSEITYLDQKPGVFPFVRGDKTCCNHWEIRQDFLVTDVDTAIEKAQTALSRGATSVGFDLTGKGDLYYHDFRKLISEIDHSSVQVHFIVGDTGRQILDFLIKALDELNIDRAEFKGSVEFDPLSHLAASGGFYYNEQDDMDDAGKLLFSVKELPGLRVLAVKSHLFSDSGATIVQELAIGLSMISDYLVRLTDEETNAADVAQHMQWNMGVGSDYFMEIARLRAARQLFAALMSSFGPEFKESPIFIHSITTKWNKTLYDPHVNILRLTTEAMAAALGGCNSLLVRPFDSTYNESGDFSERLARNIQIILKEESYFGKVVDPAAGSYYIESITHSLIESAWALFLKIDEQGGFIKSFNSGFISDEIKATGSKRMEMVASRREMLLGTNQYPNVNESVTGCIDEKVAFPEPDVNAERIAAPIIPIRAATEFEKVRLSTERHKGARPKVFMLTYGNLAMRLARSQFSSNFFTCAGYEIIDNLGFLSASEGVNAALEAKADIVVVCSSDDEYASVAPEVAKLIGDKAIVVVAGAPANMEELKQQGITEFIHIRSNVLETLKRFHSRLGIKLI
jgi:methylmalonyl-CoA mutase